jgi:tetratricopeptide (TPR) repeat protein
LAFAKLAELAPEQIGPAIYLEHLRLALGENLTDLEAALAFAQYTEGLQLYETAANGYEYCAELFSYLYPSQAPPAHIYLPWILSSYNTQRNQHRCLQIASRFRQSGQFNLFLEVIAGKAAAKVGNTEQANQILQATQDKALEFAAASRHSGDDEPRTINYKQLAWFYCFASPDASNAINRANKAYSIEPNSPTAAAILAYSLVMNGQIDWAKPLIDNYQHNQIADLTLAKIQLSQGQKDLATGTLKSAIAKDPGSLEAEHAKEILTRHGGEYMPPLDPDITSMVLRNTFGQAVVPVFTRPGKIISIQLNVRGSEFFYGSKFDASIAITNNSAEPLVVSDDGLFTGHLRIDASITGDLNNKKIPNLVSVKIRPALPIKPGRSFLIPLRLFTAELRHLLLTHPQASVDIEFTAYLDPVTTAKGITNRLTDINPAKVVVKRPGVKLTGKFLRNRFNSLTKGRQGQKIRTAQLFTGLLAEQHAMANRDPLYKFMYADWMPDLLKSALLHNLTDDDWVAKVHTMAGMLLLPLDYELTNALAENLNDTHWPVRMMAIYLLAKSHDSNFTKVLDWTAKYDSSSLVRDMAITLGAAKTKEKLTSTGTIPN